MATMASATTINGVATPKGDPHPRGYAGGLILDAADRAGYHSGFTGEPDDFASSQ